MLQDALSAARWVAANRALPGDGFRHGADDRGGPFLGDTLAMGRALIDLCAAAGDRHWLAQAQDAGEGEPETAAARAAALLSSRLNAGLLSEAHAAS